VQLGHCADPRAANYAASARTVVESCQIGRSNISGQDAADCTDELRADIECQWPHRPGQWFAELVATFGLWLTSLGCLARAPTAVPYSVGLYITAAYWFTASTSFANPAVTIARAFSNTFAGIVKANQYRRV
jgi:glycerol uptake facilitator-like aquaporin